MLLALALACATNGDTDTDTSAATMGAGTGLRTDVYELECIGEGNTFNVPVPPPGLVSFSALLLKTNTQGETTVALADRVYQLSMDVESHPSCSPDDGTLVLTYTYLPA